MLKGVKIWILMIIVAFSVLITSAVYINNESIDTHEPDIQPSNLSLDILTDKTNYGLDEYVNITIRIINFNNTTILNFSSDHQYDLTIYDSTENEVFNLFENFTAYNDPTYITLLPKSENILLNKFTWNRADKNGRQVQPGNYTVHSQLVGYNISDKRQISIGEHRAVYIKVVTVKNLYRMGENVSISAYLVNEMTETLIIWFSNRCPMDAKIYNSTSDLIFDQYYFTVCPQVISPLSLEPNEEGWPFYFIWNQLNYTYEPNQDISVTFIQVPPDLYAIKFVLRCISQVDPYSSWNTPLDYRPEGNKYLLIV